MSNTIFALYQDIKFDRPIDPKETFVSPGGYEIVCRMPDRSDKTVHFDFEDYAGSIDDNDPTVLHCEQRHPDGDVFPDVAIITADMLQNVVGIEDWYIHVEQDDDQPVPEPVKIDALFDIVNPDGTVTTAPVTIPITPSHN